MSSIREVASQAGVSIATVSYVFSGAKRVSEATEQKVRDVARKLGYVPNPAARALVTKSGGILAVVVSDLTNSFFSPVLRGVEDVAHKHNYIVMVGNSDESGEKEAEYLRRLSHHYVDGVLLSPARDREGSPAWARDFADKMVLINRRLEGLDADFVASDNRSGAVDAVHYLADRGHTKIGLVVGPQHISTHRERYDGYRAALDETGIPLDPDLIKITGLGSDSAYQATKDLFRFRWDRRPTAVFAASGVHATGAYQAVLELGLRIPEDLSFIAFDRTSWTQMTTPPLTTVEQPSYEMGKTAAHLLLDRLKANQRRGPQQRLLRPTVREGGSVRSLE